MLYSVMKQEDLFIVSSRTFNEETSFSQGLKILNRFIGIKRRKQNQNSQIFHSLTEDFP